MTANSSPNSGEIIVHVFGRTDVGRTREHNEDSFVVADLNTMNATLQPEVRTHRPGEMGSLFMVADGMGGAAAGEIASAMATEVVLQELGNAQKVRIAGLVQLTVRVKPAQKKRKGRNPATGEEITIAAKPASVDVRARPLAKAKAALPSVQKARRRLAPPKA